MYAFVKTWQTNTHEHVFCPMPRPRFVIYKLYCRLHWSKCCWAEERFAQPHRPQWLQTSIKTRVAVLFVRFGCRHCWSRAPCISWKDHGRTTVMRQWRKTQAPLKKDGCSHGKLDISHGSKISRPVIVERRCWKTGSSKQSTTTWVKRINDSSPNSINSELYYDLCWYRSKEHLNAMGVPQWPQYSGTEIYPIFNTPLPATVVKRISGNVAWSKDPCLPGSNL